MKHVTFKLPSRIEDHDSGETDVNSAWPFSKNVHVPISQMFMMYLLFTVSWLASTKYQRSCNFSMAQIDQRIRMSGVTQFFNCPNHLNNSEATINVFAHGSFKIY
jgi:hypothetical protein